MLEVIIAILTITAFLTGTLQLMAVDALYRVRAKRQAQANFWIQEDFEEIKFLASSLDVNSDFVSPDVCTDINRLPQPRKCYCQKFCRGDSRCVV